MWPTAIVGIVGTIVGIVVGQVLSAAREQRNWVNDQKRLEYRELIDQLFQTVTVVSKNRPNLSEINLEPINDAVLRLSRMFADRIFVVEIVFGHATLRVSFPGNVRTPFSPELAIAEAPIELIAI